jgi:hypothetical protein
VSQQVSVWIVIVAALAAANLPFLTQRMFAVIPLPTRKTLAIRFAELVVFYFGVGGLGLLLEKRAGQIAPQGWEFYAITGALFVVLAFPGFVWQYLWKHGRH